MDGSLLSLSWLVLIALALILHVLLPFRHRLPPVLAEIYTYGKLKSSANATDLARFLPPSLELINSVPRRYFTHFYVWGSFWNIILLSVFIIEIWSRGGGGFGRPELEVGLTLSLLLFQTLRRLMECVFVTRHSQHTMHCGHYILGLYFYTAVGPTAMLHSYHLNNEGEPLSPLHWRYLVAVVIFFWASYHQYKCHLILADIRNVAHQQTSTYQKNRTQNDSSTSRKDCSIAIPRGDWFQLVSCPHYTAETIIYFSLLLVQWGSLSMVLPCSFVLIVLSLNARQMHSWYRQKFDNYPSNRRTIIPYIF